MSRNSRPTEDTTTFVKVPKIHTFLQILTILAMAGSVIFWWHRTETRLEFLEKNVEVLGDSYRVSTYTAHQTELAVTKLTTIVDDLKDDHRQDRKP